MIDTAIAAEAGTPPPEYWATQAQVIATIVLAMIVEVRVVRAQWTEATPPAMRSVQTFLWFVIGAILVVGESAALRGVRGDDLSENWVWIGENAIASAVGLLVLGPLMGYLVEGNSGLLALLIAQPRPWTRLRIRWMEIRIRRGHRLLNRSRGELFRLLIDNEKDLAQARAGLAEVERWRSSVTPSQDPEQAKVLANVDAILARMRSQITAMEERQAGVEEDWRRRIAEELVRERQWFEDSTRRRAELAELSRADRKLVAIGLAGGDMRTHAALAAAMHLEPDDGGFLSLVRTGAE